MTPNHRWKILALIVMSLIAVGFGVWLFRAGFHFLGAGFIAVFLWRAQQFSVWMIAPGLAPSDETPPLTSRWQRLLLALISLAAAGVSTVGVYLWYSWPEEWQAGLVIVLFGLIVLGPVTLREIQLRRGLGNTVR